MSLRVHLCWGRGGDIHSLRSPGSSYLQVKNSLPLGLNNAGYLDSRKEERLDDTAF